MNDIALELAQLHILKGLDFTRQLQKIIQHKVFIPVQGETEIFSAIDEQDEDYVSLLNAARRAVGHGFRVYILPNPKGIRTADFIFLRKGVFRMYDLKTIQGKTSIMNRLIESIGQTNHVLLNMATTYNGRLLATQVRRYFEINPMASEVLIFKSGRAISIKRNYALDKKFLISFPQKYGK